MPTKRCRQRVLTAGAVGLLSLFATACGTSGASKQSTGPSTTVAGGGKATSAATVNVAVGVLPIADVAPLYLGIKEGYFAKEHLNVTPHSLQGGAAVASAVIGGSLQFGFGATANLVLARAHGLPLEFVANGDQAAANASSAWSGILVGAHSGITSIKQLAGKTVAANATEGENQLALDSILERNGVSPSSVHVVALPFPTMPSALASGQVAAVTEVEPFVSAIQAKGGVLLSPLFEGEQPSQMVAGYFTTSKEIQGDASLVQRFVTAMNEALDYAAANPSAVRAIIPTYTKIPAAVASKMRLPVWSSVVNTASISSQEQLMHQLGWITTVPSVSSLVWTGAQR